MKLQKCFFDLTPGTPEIYREELLTKLYTIGYDVGDNIMYGTDSTADVYNTQWPSKWLGIDGKIMDKLGVSKENREKMYYKNIKKKSHNKHLSTIKEYVLERKGDEVSNEVPSWVN